MKDKQVYQKTLELFNNECAICGNNEVAMHHIRYGSCGRKTYMGNVIPLCHYHHQMAHSNKRLYQPMLIKIIDERLENVHDI